MCLLHHLKKQADLAACTVGVINTYRERLMCRSKEYTQRKTERENRVPAKKQQVLWDKGAAVDKTKPYFAKIRQVKRLAATTVTI